MLGLLIFGSLLGWTLLGSSLLSDNGSGGSSGDGPDDDDRFEGTAGPDRFDGGDGDDLIRGAAGDDSLTGGNGADTLEGGLGRDRLLGGAGGDVLATQGLANLAQFNGPEPDAPSLAFGGDGNDTIYAMSANDSVFGGNGSDRIELYADALQAFGGEGNDVFRSGLFYAELTSNVTISGEGRADSIAFAGGDLRLFGGDGADSIAAGDGDGSIVDGGGGNDLILFDGDGASNGLRGGDGDDTIRSSSTGDIGNVGDGNILNGGGGNDRLEIEFRDASTLTGGDGADSFALWDKSQDQAPNADDFAVTITDFNPAVDRLLISNTGGNPLLRIENDTVTNTARVYVTDGAATNPNETLLLVLRDFSALDASMIRFVAPTV